MSRLSIRARITLGSLAIAAILLTVALVVIRGQVSTILTGADTALAQGDLVSFAKDITSNPNETVDDPGTGVLVYVRNPQGEVQVNTLPHDVVAGIDSSLAENTQYTMRDDEGRGFVVVGRTVPTPAGSWMLWSARSTSASEISIGRLDQVLVIGGVALLAAFGAASWLLATTALRPVARMRRRASSLRSAMDGDLPVGEARDELSALATTLNDLLARVRASTTREKQMVSDAAHELRTPLASLKTQLELAHDDFGDADALAAHLTGAEASVDRLASLATNLLELSRRESDESAMGSSTTDDLVTELMGSIDRARMLGLAKSAQIGFDVVGISDQQTYPIDLQSFGRIADNLLSNAVAAVPTDGSVEVVLSQADHGLVLDIRDDGPGMTADYIPRAFERFSRPDSARTTSSGGSGLGLALVKAIVVAAGGNIALRNESGLVVTVTIPNM